MKLTLVLFGDTMSTVNINMVTRSSLACMLKALLAEDIWLLRAQLHYKTLWPMKD